MIEGAADLSWLEMTGRVGLAAVLGGVMGLEREFDGQDAGFRTHLLVAVGAALFGVMSVGAFDDFIAPRSETNVAVDVTRIAAYVAPGIGFIGGGAIIKHGGKVSGITTAASLWTVAAIGVAAGLGLWAPALAVTTLALTALLLLEPLGHAVSRAGRRRRATIVVQLDDNADIALIMSAIHVPHADALKQLRFGSGPGHDQNELTAEFWDHDSLSRLQEVAIRLRAVEGVRSVSIGS